MAEEEEAEEAEEADSGSERLSTLFSSTTATALSAFLLPSFTLSLPPLLILTALATLVAAAGGFLTAAALPATEAAVGGLDEVGADVGVAEAASEVVPLLVRFICGPAVVDDESSEAGVVDSILIVCPLLVVILVVPVSDVTVGLLGEDEPLLPVVDCSWKVEAAVTAVAVLDTAAGGAAELVADAVIGFLPLTLFHTLFTSVLAAGRGASHASHLSALEPFTSVHRHSHPALSTSLLLLSPLALLSCAPVSADGVADTEVGGTVA